MTGDHLEVRSGLATVRVLRFAAMASIVFGAAALTLAPTAAQAVPSFARQTGLACEACHTIPPELTPFGRRFKLNAYTMTTKPPLVSDIDDHKRNTVWLTDIPGISILLQSTYDHWSRPPPDSLSPTTARSQSDTFQFPQQMSIMYAGAISDHFGAWLQMTYLQNTGSLGIDNNDVRYSDHTDNNDWVWGVTLNNNPSFQDVWNTGIAYGIPYFPVQTLWSATQPIGGTGPRTPLFTQFPGLAAGLGAYVWYKDSVYLELSEYHAAKSGSAIATLDSSNLNVGGGTMQSFNPYWRAAYERDWGYNSIMIGTSGMYVRFVPSVLGATVSPGNTNRYLDLSLDWQYQYNGQHNVFTFLGHYTHETQENDAGLVPTYFSNSTDHLNQLQLTGEYYRDRRFGGLVSFRRTTGTTDTAANGGDGSPGNQYEVFELDYLPWYNAKLLLQYDLYNVVANNQNPFFLAGLQNPKASDNNTWVVGLWMDF
ncbi:MAG: hypothetical protein ACHQIL_07785 [Steroidobacterales bacterium]